MHMQTEGVGDWKSKRSLKLASQGFDGSVIYSSEGQRGGRGRGPGEQAGGMASQLELSTSLHHQKMCTQAYSGILCIAIVDCSKTFPERHTTSVPLEDVLKYSLKVLEHCKSMVL